MLPILLFAAIAPTPGGLPSDWKSLNGISHVNYRWARPTSNSCVIEFAAVGEAPERLQLQIKVKVFNTRQAPQVEEQSDSAMTVEPTKIRPQTEDRVFSIELLRYNRGVESLHDCYGVNQVEAQSGPHHENPVTQPLSQSAPR